MQKRIYVPLTQDGLLRLAGGEPPQRTPFRAYAVTSRLRREHPAAGDEKLEYLAFLAAAGSGAGWAPVVAAADVDDADVDDADANEADGSQDDGSQPSVRGAPAGAVRVVEALRRRHVASYHVADATVRGDPADDIPGYSRYSWYDATELDVVADLLG